MEDPGTLLYVAFVIISLIAGYFRNRKKKMAEEEANAPLEMPETFSRSDVEARMEQQRQQQLESKRRLVAIENESQIAMRKASKKRIANEDFIHLENEASSEEETREFEEFDARKAIIYSEIMNPPYL